MSKEDILGGVKMYGFFRSMAFKKCMLILIWGVTLFAVGFGISFYRGVGKKYDLVQEVPIKEISVEGLADGTYTGEYTYETLYAKVSVIVKGEEIKKITLDQFVDIINSIEESQSVMVDDISGATDSSRVIKLAVMNALEH